MYRYKIDLRIQLKSGAPMEELMERTRPLLHGVLVVKEGSRISARCSTFRSNRLDERELAELLDWMSIYVTEGEMCVSPESDGASWRYRFCKDDGRFIREKSVTFWEEDDHTVYCGRGSLVLAPKEDSREFEDGKSRVLDSLRDLFTGVCADGDQISVSFRGTDFDPEYTASELNFISEHIKEGSIIMGRADDGPGLKDVKRWRYVFEDGEMSFQDGTLVWE